MKKLGRIVVLSAALGALLIPSPAEAHPFGMCHYSVRSGHYVYFPAPEQQEAANQHHRLHRQARESGNENTAHYYDYPATAEDRAHYDAHKAGTGGHTGQPGARKCVSTPPTGYPTNKYDTHA